MKRIVLLLLALSVFCVAKPADESTDAQALPEEESLRDSTITVYIHPLNFMVPYSHFWGGINVPNGITDYPQFYLTLEWKLMEKISLISTPHFVRVDRTEDDDDGYKIYDIGLQESFRLYGVGGKRWRYFQAGMIVDHLNIDTEKHGDFNGWLWGFMLNGGVKKVLNDGEGFFGRLAVFLDAGFGYVWTSKFEADRKNAFFKMDKGLVIDINAAIGFQI